VAKQTTKPESILTEALRVTTERPENYGKPLANHKRIADLWNGYIYAKSVQQDGSRASFPPTLSPADVVNMMILLKIARELHTSKKDNFVDMAGYARNGAQTQGHE
jgi:hypothetical protein